MNGELVIYISKVESVIVFVIFIIAFYELLGVVLARIKGLTKNVSRIVSHSIICLISLVLLFNSLHWITYITQLQTQKIHNVTVTNWPFLLVSVTMGLLMVYEFIGIYTARKAKLTKNISRIITHFVLLLLFCVLFYFSVVKWNTYIEILAQPSITIQPKQ
jgi:hypothetical protein